MDMVAMARKQTPNKVDIQEANKALKNNKTSECPCRLSEG